MAENDGLFGMGGTGLLVVLFFLMAFGGFGGIGGNSNAALSNEMQRGFDNQNSMANQRETLAAVTAGTAQSVAATNQTFHDLLGALDNRYGEIVRDIGALQVAQSQAIANQNQCCCDTKMLISETAAQNRYDALMNTNAINATTVAQTQKILDAIAQNKIDSLEKEVASLQLANQLNGVVKYPNGWTYNAGTSPFCGGCGCMG